jgi:N-acetylneuraminic acid mutarotase
MMERIAGFSTAPIAIMAGGDRQLVLAFSDGLAILREGNLEYATRTRIDGAAEGPDRAIYLTRAGQVLRFDPAQGDRREDVTADFGGPVGGDGHVVRGPCGEIFVEGCSRYRRLNGTYDALPVAADGTTPLPLATDTFGNRWSLRPDGAETRLLVLPANAPDLWQDVPVPGGRWAHLLADCDGFLWIGGPAGVHCWWPRDDYEPEWQAPGGVAAESALTALTLSADDRVLLATDSGVLLELDIDAAGKTIERRRGEVPDAARSLHVDASATIWAGTDDGLYRQPPLEGSWHVDWEAQPGRLPGGGNHDIFSVPWQGRLYTAGGLTRYWGFPTRQRIFDDLFAFDPTRGCWEVISTLSFPRRYNGIAELDGRIWIVGGEGELGERGGEPTTLDVVDIYDPATDTWTPGPTLNQVRTDPFVMTSGGRIWAVGGACDPSTKLISVESIGAGETAWRFEPDLPQPTRQGGCCALDGWLYVASIDGFFAFDTATGRWDEEVPQPGEIGQAPLVTAYQGEVWMMGGFHYGNTRCYHPKTRVWRAGAKLPTEQSWGAAAVLDGQLYITGGAHRSQIHDAVIYDDRTWRLRQGVKA